MRWSEPDNPDWKLGIIDWKGHLIRIFSCGVLIQAGARQGFDGENQTLIQLIESALVLGHVANERTLQLLSWRMLKLKAGEEERPFFVLAILLLAVYLHHTSEEGSRLLILGEWVIQEEDQLRQEQLQYYNYSPSRQRQLSRWLLGLTGSKQRQEKWGKLARQILLNPTKRHPVEADEVLRLIGSQFE